MTIDLDKFINNTIKSNKQQVLPTNRRDKKTGIRTNAKKLQKKVSILDHYNDNSDDLINNNNYYFVHLRLRSLQPIWSISCKASVRNADMISSPHWSSTIPSTQSTLDAALHDQL